MNKRIRVLVFPVMAPAYETFVDADNTLAGLQALVGGYIDILHLDSGLDIWCNDEGLYTEKPNRLVNGQPLYGTLVMARSNRLGETIGVTDEDVEKYRDAFPVAITFPGEE